MELSTRLATSAASTFAAFGAKNRSASVVPGWFPEKPSAPRSRRLPSQDHLGKKGSWEATHDTLALGEDTALKFDPKALLSSARRAPVTNSRSRRPTCCCTNTPSVFASLREELTSGTAPAPTWVAPGGRLYANAPLRSKMLLKN